MLCGRVKETVLDIRAVVILTDIAGPGMIFVSITSCFGTSSHQIVLVCCGKCSHGASHRAVRACYGLEFSANPRLPKAACCRRWK